MPRAQALVKDITHAVSHLKRGGVIAFPTETTYGLGGDPRKQGVVTRIFSIKQRDPSKPLLLVAGSWTQVENVAHLSPKTKAFAKTYWPGPLTLILPAKEGVGLVAGVVVNGEVAVRYSSSSHVRRLTRAFGFPIIATSANLSGQPDSRSAQAIQEAGLAVDAVLDGGDLPFCEPSTVARVREDGAIEIIRQGGIHLPECVTGPK